MRKKILAGMAALLLTATVLGGCLSKDQPENTSTDTKAETGSSLVNPAGVFPIAKEKVTLKVLIKGNARVENFETNLFTKEYEEKTNVHIEWEVAPEKNFKEKLNLVLASGDLPDVIIDMEVSPAQQMIYGKQGLFLPLNKYIDLYGVELKKVFQDLPQVKETITAPDGNIYALPQVANCYHCLFGQRMWIYKPWLDKLGLAMPTTTDEYYQVLKAFKEKDPNGNGKADEVPLATSTDTLSLDSYLMNSFIYTNLAANNNYLMLNQGKVDIVANKPEWKEGLKYLRKLYAEKLIAPESFTQDKNQLRQLGENPEAPLLGSAPAFLMSDFTQIEGNSGRWADYVMLPPLKGPQGVRIAARHYYNPARIGRFIITKNAKHPEIAYRWVDALYSDEMSTRSVDGREGIEWRKANPDEKGIDGKPAIWAKMQAFGAIQNVAWAQSVPHYKSEKMRLGMAVFKNPEFEVILYEDSKNKYEPYSVKQEMVVPPLFFNEEQASEIADLQKTIEDFITTSLASFVTGDKDIDKEWNNYVSTLEGMNLKRYLEINQEAYDAKMKSGK